MSFKDKYHPKIKKDLKKLDKQVINTVFKNIDKILQAPLSSDQLGGDLKDVFGFHFKANKVEYRIAYLIEEKNKSVYFVMVGKRESFYEILKRRVLEG